MTRDIVASPSADLQLVQRAGSTLALSAEIMRIDRSRALRDLLLAHPRLKNTSCMALIAPEAVTAPDIEVARPRFNSHSSATYVAASS